MALLNFPSSPVSGQLYPVTPVIGQNQYRYDSATSTWVLLGAATAVIPGTYGSDTEVAQFTVDAQGRLTFAQNVLISSTAGGTVTQIDTGTGLSGGPITGTGTVSLDTAYTDTLYLQLAGGTMTGDITFSGTQTFPAQDLQEVTDAGAVTTNAIDVAGLVAAGLSYPSADGALGDVLITDGAGTLSFVTPPIEDLDTVTTAGNTTTNSIDVGALIASGLTYPVADGTLDQVLSTDGAGTLGWLSTVRVVAAPTNQSDPGAAGEVAYDAGYWYWHDGTDWQRVAAEPPGW